MSRAEEIRTKADEVFQQHGLAIPVKIIDFANLLGLNLKFVDSEELFDIVKEHAAEELAGIVKTDILGYFDPEAKTCYLNNSNQSLTRLRFTIAHELAHFLLHADASHEGENGKRYFRRTTLKSDIAQPAEPAEVEANYFAAFILMPDSEIEKRLKLTKFMVTPKEIIDTFSTIFGVSPESMNIRLKTFRDNNPEAWRKYGMDKKFSS